MLPEEDVIAAKRFVPSTCTNVELFSRGKRGVIFKALHKGRLVVVKVPRPGSDVPLACMLEGNYLKKVNALGIGPQLIDYGDMYVVMDFVEGTLIGEFVKTASQEDISVVFSALRAQLEKLDVAGINKFEMTNPYKHVIVQKNLHPVLIDFERARFTARTKNVAQFEEYVRKITASKTNY